MKFLLLILASVLCFLAAIIGAVLLLLLHRKKGSFFDSDGVRIHYTDEGQGEPVILVHGYAVTADQNWRIPGNVRALSKKYRVITMDDRGHGLSDKPRDAGKYGLETVRDVIRLMDHLGIAKAHVAGYSMGGFITLKLAMMYPERLLSAVVGGAGWTLPTDENRVLLDKVVSSMESGRGIRPLAEWLRPVGHKQNRLLEWLVVTFINNTNDLPALGATMRAIDQLEVSEAELRANKVPILTIVGTADPLRNGVDALTGVLANHENLFIQGGDHMTAILGPRFRNGMLDFFAKHSASQSKPA